jgi:hypothetical protein
MFHSQADTETLLLLLVCISILSQVLQIFCLLLCCLLTVTINDSPEGDPTLSIAVIYTRSTLANAQFH